MNGYLVMQKHIPFIKFWSIVPVSLEIVYAMKMCEKVKNNLHDNLCYSTLYLDML